MNLTKNFTAAEFDATEPYPAYLADTRLQLAQLWQWLRDLTGRPIRITSAYRSPAHNKDVGGVAHSQHMNGQAADGYVLGVSNRTVAAQFMAAEARGEVPDYGQIIFYTDTGHVHFSLGTKREKLIAWKDSEGTRRYKPLLRSTDIPLAGRSSLVALALVCIFVGSTILLALWGRHHV